MSKPKLSPAAEAAFAEHLRTCEDIMSEDDAEEEYRNWIDELEGDISVGSIKWQASYVLESLDPIAFRCGFSDWQSSEELNDISVDGVLMYSRKTEEDLLDDWLGDNAVECEACGLYVLAEDAEQAIDEDGATTDLCHDCFIGGAR